MSPLESNKIQVFELMAFPPISFFAYLLQMGPWAIERHENYNKRSYRNRYDIMDANGRLPMVIPLKKGKNNHLPITEVRIAKETDWPARHRQAIKSAYGRAPFYEDYADAIVALFFQVEDTLFEFNSHVLKVLLNLLGMNDEIRYTPGFIRASGGIYQDKKGSISPLNPLGQGFPHYQQVFSDRLPFLPDLSILDLLFNKGPEARLYLSNIILKG